MSYYRMQELDIAVPDNWLDGTMNVFLLGARDEKGKGSAALTIVRDHQHPRDELHEYVDTSLVQGAKRFAGYQLIRRRSITIDDINATELVFTWITPDLKTMKNFQAIMKMDATFMNFTLTVNDESSSELEIIWHETIASIRRRNA